MNIYLVCDCHIQFHCQAFDMLERLDPNPEYWEGKRGAAVGLFQVILHISDI